MYAQGNVSKKLLLTIAKEIEETRRTSTVMKTNDEEKLKGKLHETQYCTSDSDSDFCPEDPTTSSSQERNKRKRKERTKMQFESTSMGVSAKSERLKSDKEVCSDNSKKPQSERKRTRDCDIYEDEEAKRSVMQRAAELLARLAKEYNLPSFVKCMLPSNVSQGFWLHLPKKFCTVNLPNEDTPVVLVDELGREHTTSYLLGRNGLSAGWRAFSMKHKLLKGDLLIFLLTEPCKFKVHIVRVNDIEVLFAALCLMDLRFSCEGNDSDSEKKDKRKRRRRNYVDPALFEMLMPSEKVEERDVPKSSSSNSDGFSSEVIEGSESTD
ncbi:hypothetical protein ABFS82_02G033100 [Erythranthe guttata]|uniref:B3 domain-containing protein At3g19184-like n=1 Tax=Erythranthe guttata TaxID=4155 RepID=UPI00064D842D|nr:PREDICTED: B3 domain-containing protein At3g19184-like [Erythranthe guttata]XP_012836959.1 PREDICTED: B3 domain-containing protein At3g19184-like [Erythranthe guttata]|eukprot:XP_012836958.1 PREDICTED: B3 domain-containing protein At3g19184-like [Erythranthe guttata]